MKRILGASLALAVSATLVFVATSWKHGVPAVHAQGGCSVATLTGNYSFTATGATAPSRSGRGKNNVPLKAWKPVQRSWTVGRQGLSRWRGGRFACTSLIRQLSLERLTVARYDFPIKASGNSSVEA